MEKQYANIIIGAQNVTLPNPLGTTWSPTWGDYSRAGYREVTEIEQPPEGYRAEGYNISEIDENTCKLVITRLINIAEEEAEKERQRQEAERQRQLAKSVELKTAENSFLKLCDQLTGTTTHTKLGFAELQALIQAIPDQTQQVYLAVQLLNLDAQGKTFGGNSWWYDCIWHQEIEA